MELLTGMVGLPSVKPLETASAVLLELYLTNSLFFLIQQFNNQSEPSQTGLDRWIIFSCWLWNIFYDVLFLFYVYVQGDCGLSRLEEQQVLLTAQPSLNLPHTIFLKDFIVCKVFIKCT